MDSGTDITPLNSVTPNGMPMSIVIMIPRRIAPGTLRAYRKPVMISPMKARKAEPEVISPRATRVALSSTTTPALFRPINAIKSPIPAPMAFLRLIGIASTIASLTLVRVRTIKMRP